MSTQTVVALNQLKGPHPGGDLHCYEVVVQVTGSYLTATQPSFDLLAAFQSLCHEGVSDINVKAVTLFQDYNDGTNVYTADNSEIVLSSTHNKVVTFELDSGATDGDTGGTEVTNATAISGYLSFIAVLTITGA